MSIEANRESSGVDGRTQYALSQETSRLLIDPATYGNTGSIVALHRDLRASNPVALAKIDGYSPFWVLTKHADVVYVGARDKLFPSGQRTIFLTDAASEAQIRASTGGDPNMSRSVLTLDEPEHGKYRRVAQAWFMPKNLKTLEARIRELARSYIARMGEGDWEGDFASEIAIRYPLNVILEIMGIAQSEEPYVLKLTQELFGASDPTLSRMGKEVDAKQMAAEMAKVFVDFKRYFADLAAERRRNPGDDVASLIVRSTIDGQPMPLADAVDYYQTLATAGHDTTASTLAGAVLALCQNPDELCRVKKNPALIPDLVEESLRWSTPIRHFMRTAVQDVDIRGRKIRAGDGLMLNYLSANRDEEVFEDPFAFRIDRRPNPHVAFGFGAHVCLGLHLAKMELRVFLEEFLARVTSMTLAGKPHQVATILIGGVKSLPIRITR